MTVDVARAGAVVTVTLNRPAKLNAVTDDMWRALEATFTALEPTDRVLVLAGSGGAFCAGSDVGGLLGEHEPLADRIRRMNRVLLALYELAVPTVCRLDGIAAGAGANLALVCDFVVATSRAQLSELFIRRGLSLDSGASWLLPRLVGTRRAAQLALLGDTVDAETAAEWGLVSEVVAPAALDDRMDDLVGRLVALPPAAVNGTKRLLHDSWGVSFAEAMEAETENQLRVIAEPDAQHALSTFGHPS